MTKPRTLSSHNQLRIGAGLVVQPLLAAALTYVTFPVIDATGRPLYGGHAGDSGAALSLAFGVGVAVAVVVVVAVLPTVVWLVKRMNVTLQHSVLFGVLFGNLPVVAGILLAGGYGAAGILRAVVFGTTLGVSGATVFWAVSIRGHNRTPRQQAD